MPKFVRQGDNTLIGNNTFTGTNTFTGSTVLSGGVNVPQSVANVTEAAPTDAQLDSAFGTPAELGRGFIGTVDDNDGSTASVLCWTTDSAWFHVVGTLSS